METASHFASHAPELVRWPGDLEALKNAGLCELPRVVPIKQIARTRKRFRKLLPVANISSSPAPAAQPPQPACRGALPGGHQPHRAEQTVQSFTGANRKTRISCGGLLNCFWNFYKLEIKEGHPAALALIYLD